MIVMTKFNTGDRVVATSTNPKFDQKFGVVHKAATDRNIVKFDHEKWVDQHHTWSDENLTKVETPDRPRAALKHATSRSYAAAARSRVLEDSQDAILATAADGGEVDVFEFRTAATAALSLASTRSSQSAERRRYASEARHLIYWADAILASHIDGLPPMEAGARSPRIKELELENENLKETIRKASETLDEITAAHRIITNQRNAWESRAIETQTFFDAENAARVATEDERDTLASVLDYALDLIEIPNNHRVLGFWDGLKKS